MLVELVLCFYGQFVTIYVSGQGVQFSEKSVDYVSALL